MNALEMLQAYLQRASPGGGTRIGFVPPPDRRPGGMPTPQELADLARRQRNWEAQQDSPVYDEGEIMAPEPWWNEALGGQLQLSGPQRDEALPADLADTRDKENWPVLREGEYASRRPQGVSPFASPLNQLMQLGRRAPLSMY